MDTKYIKKFRYKKLSIAMACILCLSFAKPVYAQNAISLSITPPLFEAIIQPGKEVKQIYTITNNGGDTLVVPKIYYFEATDENGNISLTEDEAPEWVKYSKEPFNLKFQDSKQFTVLISPPEDSEEIDHFLTLVFENTVPTDIKQHMRSGAFTNFIAFDIK